MSIPLYVAPAANGGSDTSPAADTASLSTALTGWLASSAQVRVALAGLVEKRIDIKIR